MALTDALADVRRVARGPIRLLFVGQLLKEVGYGLTLALLVIYLTEVRDLPVVVATGLLAWQAILALAVSPLVGSLVDRVGPRPVLMGGALVEAAGVFAYRFVDTRTSALVAATVVALGGAALWGPMTTFIARLVPPADRSTAFGFQFMLTNLGLGLGALMSALIVDKRVPGTFELLYTLTALSYVALFVAVLLMGPVGGRLQREESAAVAQGTTSGQGWREVLRDRTLLRFTLMALIMTTCAYGSIDGGLALFLDRSLGLPTSYVGITFAVNTTVIVVMQLFVLKLLQGRSRSRVLASVAGLWGGTWVLLALSYEVAVPEAAVALLLLAIGVFAVGETMWSPVAPALLNDLAPEHLRGRYNSTHSVVFGVSGALGPLIAGAFLGHGQGGLWTITLAAGCAVAALLALSLRSRLTPGQDGRGSADEPPSPDPEDLGPTIRQDVH